MAEWKKLIVSGSDAELGSIFVLNYISASKLNLSGLAAGSAGNTILVLDANNSVRTLNGSTFAQNSFVTISALSGGNPVADSPTDTLALTSSNTHITIAGDATNDRVDFNIASNAVGNTELDNSDDFTVNSLVTTATLEVGSDLTVTDDIIGGTLAGSHITGSFTGSFFGDGSNLTGVATSLTVEANKGFTQDIVLTSENLLFTSASVHGFGFTTGSNSILLTTPQDLRTTANPTFAGLNADSINIGITAANEIDTDSGNLILDSNGGTVQVDDILDVAGVMTIAGATITYDGGSNFSIVNGGAGHVAIENTRFTGNDVVIPGNLIVEGDTIENKVANLLIEDQYILIASGSTSATEGGFIVDHGSRKGPAFIYDVNGARWATTQSLAHNVTGAITPGAFMAAVVDIDASQVDIAAYQKNGNIKVDSGEIYIYA